MARYVVGDIQGCYSGLRRLLDRCQFDPQKDTLYAVGDLIGRGSEASQTLEFLISLKASFESVLGNHDLHFLSVHSGVAKHKSNDGFDDLLTSSDRERWAEWLRHRPLALQPAPRTLITHAGLYPMWSQAQAMTYAEEINQKLTSDDWQDTLANMYGDAPNHWDDRLEGGSRTRFIINALTRMRYVTEDGALELKTKSSASDAPAFLVPWFRHPDFSVSPEHRIIFGHWAALQCKTGLDNVIGLDSGYIWGGSMTALNLDTDERITVSHLKG